MPQILKTKLSGPAITLFYALGGFLFGYETGVISGIKVMEPFLRQFGHPTSTTDLEAGYALSSTVNSIIVSSLLIGSFVGALTSAFPADKFGRKWGVICYTIIFAVGIAMQTAARRIPLFVVGHFLAGIGVGGNSSIIPIYMAECSPKKIRGAIISTYQWAITIGLFLASVVTNSTQHRPDSSAYLIPITLQFVWTFILLGGTLFLPESPRWLVKCGRIEEAVVSLARYTGSSSRSMEVEAEVNEIIMNLELEMKLGMRSYLDCFRPTKDKMALRTLTGIFVQAFQQLTGINFIFYYGITFFKNSGIHDPFIISIVTNAVNVIMTIPGIWAVERLGRRRLFLIGCIGMCLCECIVAVVGETISVSNIAGQEVLIVFVCIFIAFFAATWGPVTWIVVSEIFPLHLRAKAMSISAASNWLWNFGISYATPYLVNNGHGSAGLQSKVFFIWGSTCFCGIIFSFLCIPETQGLSLEQIDVMYREVTPIRSLEYRRNLLIDNINLRTVRIDNPEQML